VTVRRPNAGLVLLAGIVLVLGSCGSDSGVSREAAVRLQFRVAAIRDAAARGDLDTAESRLAELRVDVVQSRADDNVDDAAATRILRAADAVQAELTRLEPAPTTTVSTTTTTTTEPERPGKDKGRGKGGKHGDEGD
jgi:hypothetical protein